MEPNQKVKVMLGAGVIAELPLEIVEYLDEITPEGYEIKMSKIRTVKISEEEKKIRSERMRKMWAERRSEMEWKRGQGNK
jgi:hypothetical protein